MTNAKEPKKCYICGHNEKEPFGQQIVMRQISGLSQKKGSYSTLVYTAKATKIIMKCKRNEGKKTGNQQKIADKGEKVTYIKWGNEVFIKGENNKVYKRGLEIIEESLSELNEEEQETKVFVGTIIDKGKIVGIELGMRDNEIPYIIWFENEADAKIISNKGNDDDNIEGNNEAPNNLLPQQESMYYQQQQQMTSYYFPQFYYNYSFSENPYNPMLLQDNNIIQNSDDSLLLTDDILSNSILFFEFNEMQYNNNYVGCNSNTVATTNTIQDRQPDYQQYSNEYENIVKNNEKSVYVKGGEINIK